MYRSKHFEEQRQKVLSDLIGHYYGSDRVRFTAPLRVGQRARARFVLVDVTKRDDGSFLVKATHQVEAEGSSKPCLIAEILLLFVPI